MFYVSGEAIFRVAEVQKEIQLKFEDCVSVQWSKLPPPTHTHTHTHSHVSVCLCVCLSVSVSVCLSLLSFATSTYSVHSVYVTHGSHV